MKILFATMPFDGHFNPLTGLAMYLKGKGHDVRWYTGPSYAPKLANLGIPHFPFQRATDVNSDNLLQHFPEYERLGTGPKAIEFALNKIFFGNLEAHYRDIRDLHAGFPFDAFFYDGAFYAAHLVAQKLQPICFGMAPAPTPAPASRLAPPPFFGLKPAKTIFGKLRDKVVHAMLNSSMKSGHQMLNELLVREGLPAFEDSIWNLPWARATAYFQSGCPSMDFPRQDWPKNFVFAGALLPHKKERPAVLPQEEKLARYPTLIVVSQGTVDNRDPEKLFVPTLEALKGGPHLVVATTGYKNTEALQRRFPEDNILIVDFIDFDPLLKETDLFVCNGGFGSVMHALAHGVPILSAGKLEGKNDVNARLDYCGLGYNLKTERPSPKQIAAGVTRVLGDPRYAENAARVRAELASYPTFELIERALLAATSARPDQAAPRLAS